ncbi:hypothetical protein Rhopal_004917-T1 [Rhodotorula paludigena]|uniref:Uncharacterized protein n=1 Tax=Rhodotorula paludigena TaxID=86838 RepID=A0AAV5GQY5_9BASI|nr:hypothetical protein Rhopal_004917-T1 [Rhodotorula paludigena]
MARKFLTARKSDLIRKRQEEEARLAALGEDGGDDDSHDAAHQDDKFDLEPDQESLLDTDSSDETTGSSEDEKEEIKPRVPSRGVGPASQAPASARFRPAPSPAPAPKRVRRASSCERSVGNDEELCPTCGRSAGKDAESVRKLNEFGQFLHELGGTLDTMLAWPVMAPGDVGGAGEAGEAGEEGKMGGGAGEQEGA